MSAQKRRLSKPARAHNPLYGPSVCLCLDCCRTVLALRCPFVSVDPRFVGSNAQCGSWKGHHEREHTQLVDTTFVIAEERLRLDSGPQQQEAGK